TSSCRREASPKRQIKSPRHRSLVARGLTCVRPAIAFSSEVGTGSREENASRHQKCELFRLQLERRRVDAVAQAGRARAVIEDMAEMAVAFRAQHLGAAHAVAVILLLVDIALGGGLGKARPAAAGIELGVGFEQGLAAARADIGALAVLVLVFAGE